MRQALREFGRAPARIATSIVALALALGAIGVFAIPSVSSSSLRDGVERDRMANLAVSTTDSGRVGLEVVAASVDGIEAAQAEVQVPVGMDGAIVPLIGRAPAAADLDVLSVSAGRRPQSNGEVMVTDGMAGIGDRAPVVGPDGHEHELLVVGIGSTSWWAGEDVAFTTASTARMIGDVMGSNRLAVRASDDTTDGLRSAADALRDRLALDGVVVTELPVTAADGRHPIEEDIAQVSTMIGFLGVVAGLVALVLLGSTVNTLIAERTHEVAVMRALGARRRPLRRRLRRLAMAIAAAAVVVGLPLGALVSNVIARMVMEEFLGLTPDLAVSAPVLVASAVFALLGSALVASGAARRATKRPLPEALRDRDGSPFGRRRSERVLARLRIGSLLGRIAARDAAHRGSRSAAIVAQIAAGVAALLIVASMATTINAFNASEFEPWSWASRTTVAGNGQTISSEEIERIVADDATAEPAIEATGEFGDWHVDIVGLQPETAMIDRTTDIGVWLPTVASASRAAVVSTGFAERVGIGVGDTVELRLAAGNASYDVVGLHPLQGRSVFVDVDTLSADLGSPGFVDTVFSLRSSPPDGLAAWSNTIVLDDLTADDSGRSAILMIFGAIGLVVVGVAGLAVASGLAVTVHERRREFAAMRAIGGSARDVRRTLAVGLLPLAIVGVAVGTVLGYLGGQAIANSFEDADAVEIGFVFAAGALPAVAGVAVLGVLAIGTSSVRRVGRHSVAATLRSAT